MYYLFINLSIIRLILLELLGKTQEIKKKDRIKGQN
jgi:hypothetical protein